MSSHDSRAELSLNQDPACEQNDGISLLSASVSSASESSKSGSSSCSSNSDISSATSYPSPTETLAQPSKLVVLDIRPENLFEASHIRYSRNIPLPLTQHDFYADPLAVQKRWEEMKIALSEVWGENSQPFSGIRHGKHDILQENNSMPQQIVLVVDGDGDSGRMATAMLRAKGLCVYSTEGGFELLEKELKQSTASSLVFKGL